MKRVIGKRTRRSLAARLRGAMLAFTPAALLVVGPPPEGGTREGIPTASRATVRVIIQLADAASRQQLLRESVTLPLPLDARHERVIRGLKAIHSASLSDARDALEEARRAGALTEVDRLWSVNAVVALVDPEWIPRLEADPSIARVVTDRRLRLASSPAAPAVAVGLSALGRSPRLSKNML